MVVAVRSMLLEGMDTGEAIALESVAEPPDFDENHEQFLENIGFSNERLEGLEKTTRGGVEWEPNKIHPQAKK